MDLIEPNEGANLNQPVKECQDRCDDRVELSEDPNDHGHSDTFHSMLDLLWTNPESLSIPVLQLNSDTLQTVYDILISSNDSKSYESQDRTSQHERHRVLLLTMAVDTLRNQVNRLGPTETIRHASTYLLRNMDKAVDQGILGAASAPVFVSSVNIVPLCTYIRKVTKSALLQKKSPIPYSKLCAEAEQQQPIRKSSIIDDFLPKKQSTTSTKAKMTTSMQIPKCSPSKKKQSLDHQLAKDSLRNIFQGAHTLLGEKVCGFQYRDVGSIPRFSTKYKK